MKVLIEHPHDLRDVVIPLHKGPDQAAELVAILLAQLVVSFGYREKHIGYLCLDRCDLFRIWSEVDFADHLNITFVIQFEFPELLLSLVNQVNIDFLGEASLLVVWLEGLQNFFLGIHKVQNVGIFFSRISTVQTAQSLDCLHIS